MRIDVTADLKDAASRERKGSAEYLHDEPRVPACLVRNVYSYGTGSRPSGRDRAFLEQQTEQFARAVAIACRT